MKKPDFDGLLKGLISGLLDVQRDEHVTHFLAWRFAHRTSYCLNYVDKAAPWTEECDHVNCRNVNTLGETARI